MSLWSCRWRGHYYGDRVPKLIHARSCTEETVIIQLDQVASLSPCGRGWPTGRERGFRSQLPHRVHVMSSEMTLEAKPHSTHFPNLKNYRLRRSPLPPSAPSPTGGEGRTIQYFAYRKKPMPSPAWVSVTTQLSLMQATIYLLCAAGARSPPRPPCFDLAASTSARLNWPSLLVSALANHSSLRCLLRSSWSARST